MAGGIDISGFVINYAGTAPGILEQTLSNRPAPGIVGRLFIQTNGTTAVGLYRDTGATWQPIATGGAFSGTVTSVGITAPAEITVTNSPITTSGNIALSWANEAAHTFFAAPIAGGTPSFRTIQTTDLPAGIGTVTSVGITAPTEITVTNSPITTSGSIALSWKNEAQNTFFAAPATGGAGTPAFRAIQASDLPPLTGSFWAIGGNTSVNALESFGTTSATNINILANNASVGRIFNATGNWVIAGTTDAGAPWKWQVYGHTVIQANTNSVATTLRVQNTNGSNASALGEFYNSVQKVASIEVDGTIEAFLRFSFPSRSRITAPIDGQIVVTNNAGTGFTNLFIGPASSGYVRFTVAGSGGVLSIENGVGGSAAVTVNMVGAGSFTTASFDTNAGAISFPGGSTAILARYNKPTNSLTAFAVDNVSPTATGNIFDFRSQGVNRAFIDYNGNITAPAAAYTSGGYGAVVRNATSGRFESIGAIGIAQSVGYITTVANSGSALTTFYTTTIAANTMATNGNRVVANYNGIFTNATTAMFNNFYWGFGGGGGPQVTILNLAALAGERWSLEVMAIRTGTTAMTITMNLIIGNTTTSGVNREIRISAAAGVVNYAIANDAVLQVQALNGGANDIVANTGQLMVIL